MGCDECPSKDVCPRRGKIKFKVMVIAIRKPKPESEQDGAMTVEDDAYLELNR